MSVYNLHTGIWVLNYFAKNLTWFLIYINAVCEFCYFSKNIRLKFWQFGYNAVLLHPLSPDNGVAFKKEFFEKIYIDREVVQERLFRIFDTVRVG
uniref:Uncharacterized protein n=1 Tax=Prevotella sp. GTC17253 TaxID=3236793 RepID=A0AB33IMW6_9BACT